MKKLNFPLSVNMGFVIVLALSFALIGGCKNESPVSPVSSYNTSVSAFAQGNQTDNTFALTEVKFLLRKIELESENGAEEEEVNLGPLVVNVDMMSKVFVFSFAKLVPGGYHEIHFQLHKPSPNEVISDPEFIESTNTRYSVIIKGFFNDAPFVYKTDVTVSKEVEFEGESSLTVPTEGSVNITIRITPFTWFMNSGIFMDPMDPANKHIIDQNIRNDFRRAFKDDNEDGEPD